jgi:hypothetical protein
VPDGGLATVADGPDVVLLVVSVTPYPVPLNRFVSVQVDATDMSTGSAVQGEVVIDGVVRGQAGSPFTHTFRPRRIRIPGTKPPEFDVEFPTGVVRAPGYPDAQINFGW